MPGYLRDNRPYLYTGIAFIVSMSLLATSAYLSYQKKVEISNRTLEQIILKK